MMMKLNNSILNKKYFYNYQTEKLYLVKWNNQSYSDATWEKESNILNNDRI